MSRRQKDKPGGVLLGLPDDGTEWCYGYDPDAIIIAHFVRCAKHPYYRAVRAPRADCKTCQMMYAHQIKNPLK